MATIQKYYFPNPYYEGRRSLATNYAVGLADVEAQNKAYEAEQNAGCPDRRYGGPWCRLGCLGRSGGCCRAGGVDCQRLRRPTGPRTRSHRYRNCQWGIVRST